MVNLLDLSGFVEDGIQPFFRKHLGGNLKTKPFLCSYCMSHHLGLLYLLISGNFSLIYYCALLLICWLTPVTKDILIILREWLIKALDQAAIYFHLW